MLEMFLKIIIKHTFRLLGMILEMVRERFILMFEKSPKIF